MWLIALVAGMAVIGLSKPAAAQTIPNVRGLQPFTAQTNFMSLTGYLRWQYFTENSVWISRAEANNLVASQVGGAG
jgi:hypothetical protein